MECEEQYSFHLVQLLTCGNCSTLLTKTDTKQFDTTKSGSSQSTRAVSSLEPLVGLYTQALMLVTVPGTAVGSQEEISYDQHTMDIVQSALLYNSQDLHYMYLKPIKYSNIAFHVIAPLETISTFNFCVLISPMEQKLIIFSLTTTINTNTESCYNIVPTYMREVMKS